MEQVVETKEIVEETAQLVELSLQQLEQVGGGQMVVLPL